MPEAGRLLMLGDGGVSRLQSPRGELVAPMLLTQMFAVPEVPGPVDGSRQSNVPLPVLTLLLIVPLLGTTAPGAGAGEKSRPLLDDAVTVLELIRKFVGALEPPAMWIP